MCAEMPPAVCKKHVQFGGRNALGMKFFVVKKDLHIVEQKLVRIRVRYIESKMVDELFLLLLPLGPAIFAHFLAYLLSELGRDRRKAQRFVFLPAACTFEFVATK